MIIEIEGIDGVGKTEQCKRLKEWFEARGDRAIVVKDLDSTETGKQVRQWLLSNKTDIHDELRGFLQAKIALFKEIICPETLRGAHIICDRGMGSFLSYFEAHGTAHDTLSRLCQESIPGHQKITILIDLPVEKAVTRNESKTDFGSRFDKMSREFFERQRLIYMRLAKEQSWIVILGELAIEEIQSQIIDHVLAYWKNRDI